MIWVDTTKTGAATHRSGLTRVSQRLREALGAAALPVQWNAKTHELVPAAAARLTAEDWFLTAELFSEEERPGFTAFLQARRCRLAAIYHDSIPLKHPHITWPHSVARQPGYLKLLAQFDHVWAVSQASREELLGFWRWAGIETPPPVAVLPLGADFHAAPRVRDSSPGAARADAFAGPPMKPSATSTALPRLLCLGIIEPRKNQGFLLDVCDALWRNGTAFELHLVGRVNPHFGAPIVRRISALRRTHPQRLFFHEAASDAVLARLYADARALVFPTIAEGCGLPLLEALWMGVPCVCSDLPVLRENADAGGCVPVRANDPDAWVAALRRVVTDDAFVAGLAAAAKTRPLPTWSDTAKIITAGLHAAREAAPPPIVS